MWQTYEKTCSFNDIYKACVHFFLIGNVSPSFSWQIRLSRFQNERTKSVRSVLTRNGVSIRIRFFLRSDFTKDLNANKTNDANTTNESNQPFVVFALRSIRISIFLLIHPGKKTWQVAAQKPYPVRACCGHLSGRIASVSIPQSLGFCKNTRTSVQVSI